MDEPCFTCDECIYYDGKSDRRVMRRDECPKYKITEYYAGILRKKMKILEFRR
jgi:hypothetical protein